MELLFKGMFGLVFVTGEHFKRQRRFALHVLRDFGFGRNIMEAKINTDIDRLLAHVDSASTDGGRTTRLNPEHPLSVCVASVISNVIIGERYEYTKPSAFTRLHALNKEFLEAFLKPTTMLLNVQPWLRHLPVFEHFGFNELKRIDAEVCS